MKRTKAAELRLLLRSSGDHRVNRILNKTYKKIVRKAHKAAKEGYGGIELQHKDMPTFNSPANISDVKEMLREDGFEVKSESICGFTVRWGD